MLPLIPVRLLLVILIWGLEAAVKGCEFLLETLPGMRRY